MGLLARLLGKGTKDDRVRGITRLQAGTREQTRRELISMAVRDILKKHGLPKGSITADALPGFTPSAQRGIHVQLVFRDSRPNLLSYVVAMESAVRRRLQSLDPLSPSWISGVSWRVEPTDPALWPQLPMPGQSGAPRHPARTADRTRPAAVVQQLLQSRHAAFKAAARVPGGAAPEFSPTLPMRREQEIAPAAGFGVPPPLKA
jgi:hypothetical protein